MINSMTAFAKREYHDVNCQLQWEIRALNHRYLELSFNLPESYYALEWPLRQLVKKYISRGKFDCRLHYIVSKNGLLAISCNESLLKALQQAGEHISSVWPQIQPMSINEVLRWPNMVQVESKNTTFIKEKIVMLFEQSLQDIVRLRQQEGEKLASFLLERIKEMLLQLDAIKALLPTIITCYRQKLLAQFKEAKLELEPSRLAQEMVFYAQKLDIAEEVARIEIHLDEMKTVLQSSQGAVGRRLDFLLQELHREVNTLGAKSVDIATSQAAIALKVLIEQMRQQVQNIE